jgi:hypothetical protein
MRSRPSSGVRRAPIRAVLALTLLALPLCANATEYSARPFTATVIDKETGRPLRGAVALTLWKLNFYNGYVAGILNATEAVSGPDGVFHMAAWGPMLVPKSETGAPLVMLAVQPGLYVFKAGYRLYAERTEADAGRAEQSHFGDPLWTGDVVRTVWADGKTFSLTRVADTEQYAYLLNLQTLEWLRLDCHWAKNPRMTAAIVSETNRFNALFPKLEHGIGWAHFEREPPDECGSPRDLIGPYLK